MCSTVQTSAGARVVISYVSLQLTNQPGPTLQLLGRKLRPAQAFGKVLLLLWQCTVAALSLRLSPTWHQGAAPPQQSPGRAVSMGCQHS